MIKNIIKTKLKNLGYFLNNYSNLSEYIGIDKSLLTCMKTGTKFTDYYHKDYTVASNLSIH